VLKLRSIYGIMDQTLKEETMSEEMNTPGSPEPELAGYSSWFSTWITAVTKPNENTYADIAESPEASPGKAYLWVFLAYLVNFFIVFVVDFLFSGLGGQDYGIGEIMLGGSMLALICGVPVLAGLTVLVFMITTGLIQWIARLFKGIGTYGKLAYARGAIVAPVALSSAVLSLFSSISFLGLCLWPVSILLFLYSTGLNIMAVKGINKIGWGQAIASYILPTGMFFCLSLIPAVVLIVAMTGLPEIEDIVRLIFGSIP